jgi:hypothetical protein
MKLIFNLVGGILGGVVKVALLAFTAVFVLGVLCVGLVVVLATIIRFLLTGRKPAVFATFTQFSQAAQQYRPGGWAGQGAAAQPQGDDIVDVQAHEVHPVVGDALPPKTAD